MILNFNKLKELQAENEELKTFIQSISAKDEQLKKFDVLIKKARIEYADITQRKDQTAQTLEALQNERAKLKDEIQKIFKEINQLRELKVAEHNQILKLSSALLDSANVSQNDRLNQLSKAKNNLINEIEIAEERKNSIIKEISNLEMQYDELSNRMKEVKNIDLNLKTEIEKKKEKISILIESHKAISEEHEGIINTRLDKINDEEIQLKVKQLSDEESNLTKRIYDRKNELDELEQKIKDKTRKFQNGEENKKLTIEIEEIEKRESIKQLSQTEDFKKELISEIDHSISAKKSQLESLIQDYNAKSRLLNEVSDKHKQLEEEVNIKINKISGLNEVVEITTAKLTDLDNSLNILEDELGIAKEEVKNKTSEKIEIENSLKEKLSEKKELESNLKELKETTTILAQLKNDIEQGSGLSAKRFTGILKYYSIFISEMYKQKINLEKIIAIKEKDIEEKDSLLIKKQSELQGIETSWFIEQDAAKLFKEIIDKVQKQWGQIKNIISFPAKKSFNKILPDEQNTLENDINKEKLSEFENSLMEILQNSDKYFNRFNLKEPTGRIQKEDYDIKSGELKIKIRDSLNELSELRSSINKIKEEHEEHRQDINNLVSMKQRLEKEIRKHEVTIDKYEKIMEKIIKEQNLIRGKRATKEQKDQVVKQDESKKIPNPDKFNWIKS